MKYRAYTQVAGEPKPRQGFGETLEQVEDWATKVLERSPAGTVVSIYETKDVLIKTKEKP